MNSEASGRHVALCDADFEKTSVTDRERGSFAVSFEQPRPPGSVFGMEHRVFPEESRAPQTGFEFTFRFHTLFSRIEPKTHLRFRVRVVSACVFRGPRVV